MKDLLKYIPGFRSGKRWKQIIAMFFYLITLIGIFMEGISFSLNLIGIGLLTFGIGEFLWKSLRKKDRSYSRKLMIVSAVMLVSGVMFMPESSASEEEQTPDTEQTEKEADEKAKEEAKKKEEAEKKAAAEAKKKEEAEKKAEEEAKKKEEAEKKAKEEAKRKEEEKKKKEQQAVSGKVKVHYINVGQGDSTFIELPNKGTILIDGATRSNGQSVVNYLDGLKVDKIDYVFATHPHEDHIGGLIQVIKKYSIGKIYIPEKEHTTQVFEELLVTIKNEGYSITKANAGDVIIDETGLHFNVLAPSNISGSNLNDYSIANKLTFGDINFIFTGDAEKKSETNMVNSGQDLSADVLKVGHHGGDTSTIDSFLNKVKPKYGVISAGAGNQYGHPHENVLNRLANHDVKVFRTDEDGTIIATTDGKDIEFNKKATEIAKSSSSGGSGSSSSGSSNSTKEEPKEESNNESADDSEEEGEVYITDTGSKYHLSSCHTLKKSKIASTIKEAKSLGLEPCGICRPPS